ncbi:hypothetical protein J6590_050273 [Homalodisca vitripennis]|nr:hypothetical protein J6590_050273 [Homalodisca vitripennis]
MLQTSLKPTLARNSDRGYFCSQPKLLYSGTCKSPYKLQVVSVPVDGALECEDEGCGYCTNGRASIPSVPSHAPGIKPKNEAGPSLCDSAASVQNDPSLISLIKKESQVFHQLIFNLITYISQFGTLNSAKTLVMANKLNGAHCFAAESDADTTSTVHDKKHLKLRNIHHCHLQSNSDTNELTLTVPKSH